MSLVEAWEKGGEGGVALAKKVLDVLENKKSDFEPLYDTKLSLKDKIKAVATEIYGAGDVSYSPAAERELKRITELGMGDFPVCKSKYNSWSNISAYADSKCTVDNFTVTVKNVKVSAGAGFIVVLTGDIMTMPGLPKAPAANNIDVTDDGVITGLF